MTPEQFVADLVAAFPGTRLVDLVVAQERHLAETMSLKGYAALATATKVFFLETVDLFNSEIVLRITEQQPAEHALFMERLTNFHQCLCGAEEVAGRGYPLQGYTLLRNIFDSVILTSAAAQGHTNFYLLEGMNADGTILPEKFRDAKKKEEFRVRDMMTGKKSGLTEQTMGQLDRWDKLFDYETHGSLLTRALSMDWLKGKASLSVVPNYDSTAFAMYLNRFCEIGWMVHRLLPLIQPQGHDLPKEWHDKWALLNHSYEITVRSLTSQCGKPIGDAVAELVAAKFPFTSTSHFWTRL